MPVMELALAVLMGIVERPQAARPFDRGPAVGDRLPAIEAVDQDGRPRTFESLRGPKASSSISRCSRDNTPTRRAITATGRWP